MGYECAIPGCTHDSRKAALLCNRNLVAVTSIVKLQSEIAALVAAGAKQDKQAVALAADLAKAVAERGAFEAINEINKPKIEDLEAKLDVGYKVSAAHVAEIALLRKERDELTTQLATVVSEKDMSVTPTQLEGVVDTIPSDEPVVQP